MIIFILLIYLFFGFQTYGTGDVKLWLSWAQTFVSSGFWPNFLPLSDIPLINTLIVYFSGVLTNTLFGTITAESFSGVFKAAMLPLLLGVALIAKSLTKKHWAAISILLNPAIFLNLAILGYMDVVFVFCFFTALYLLNKTITAKKPTNLPVFIYSIIMVLGFLTKPQWIMFFPILTLFGLLVFYNMKQVKPFITGFFAGAAIFLLMVSFTAQNITEVINRLEAVRVTYARTVGGQIFVVANFPNFWHAVNFWVHTCQRDCTIRGFWEGLFMPLSYWHDKQITVSGRWLFIVSAAFYGFVIFVRIIKEKLWQKRQLLVTILRTSIWMNLIYAFFNTGVHENHLIATVYLSSLLFAVSPKPRNFLLYLFFTLFNFLNLFYYYGFGLSGLFGWGIVFSPFGLNISLVLILVYSVFLLWETYSLITNKEGVLI